MAALTLVYDRDGETLTVWFGDPMTEYASEDPRDDVIVMKDAAGVVLGFEKWHVSIAEAEAASAGPGGGPRLSLTATPATTTPARRPRARRGRGARGDSCASGLGVRHDMS
jgi:hypothetical protein